MAGYDLELIHEVSNSVSIPVAVLGAALSNFKDAIMIANVSANPAGGCFIYQYPHRAVLITYPFQEEINALFI